MRKTQFLLIGSLLLLVLIGGSILLAHAQAQANASLSGHAAATRTPIFSKYSSSPGVPAIPPHLRIDATNIAAFTESDVRQYVSSQQSFGQIAPLPGTTVVIVKIEFLTSQAATKLIGESTGMPASHLLCYVELSGDFSLPTGPGGGSTSATVHTIQEVFDAQTGNLLEIGS
jgi:hypothetical protein